MRKRHKELLCCFLHYFQVSKNPETAPTNPGCSRGRSCLHSAEPQKSGPSRGSRDADSEERADAEVGPGFSINHACQTEREDNRPPRALHFQETSLQRTPPNVGAPAARTGRTACGLLSGAERKWILLRDTLCSCWISI